MGDDEAPEALVEHLLTLGLEKKEARLYARLCMEGPQRASDLAAKVNLNRTETYRALDALTEHGLVTAQLTRPTMYAAVPPDVAFADALRRHEGHRTALERAKEAAVRELERVRTEGVPDAQRHAYRIVQGRRPILTLAESLVRGMERRQRLVSTYFAPPNATQANAPLQGTIARAKEGLEMKMLFCERPGLDRILTPFLEHPNVEMRLFDSEVPIRFTIIDDTEVLVWLHSDPNPAIDARGDVAMWTNAPDFVRAQSVFYDALWARGRGLSGPIG